MGIPRATARLMLDEHRVRPFHGSVLQFGRSSIYFTQKELEKWSGLHGVKLSPVDEVRLSHDPRLARDGCIDDKTFLHQLGFETVESCDISEWEGAEHIFDLNEPVPEHLHGRFDAILDPGTILQIFHQPILLKNIFDLLKPGGRIIHGGVPSNNHMDLGFYMFSPTFFDDFYTANQWNIEAHFFCECFPYWHRGRLYSAPWKIYRYDPGCLDALRYGRYGARQTAIFFIATKTEQSTGDVVPQLGQFVRSWREFEDQSDDGMSAGDLAASGGVEGMLEGLFTKMPALSRAYLPVKRLSEGLRRRLPQKLPPIAARY